MFAALHVNASIIGFGAFASLQYFQYSIVYFEKVILLVELYSRTEISSNSGSLKLNKTVIYISTKMKYKLWLPF